MGALPLIETRNVRGPKNEHGIPMPGSGASSGTFAPKTYQGALSVNDDRNDSGLYLMGHRHYAPDLGRFISRDPIGFNGGLNLYNGASANPVTMVDPAGLQPWGVGTRPPGLAPRLESLDAQALSDALGLLTRSGYGPQANHLQKMDKAGLIRFKPGIPPLAETDAASGISLEPESMSASCVPGKGLTHDRLRNALLLATILLHEHNHYIDFTHRCYKLHDEPIAYYLEQKFLKALYDTEDPGCDRAKLIRGFAYDRYQAGHQMALGSDYAGLSTPDTYYPTNLFGF